MTALELNFLDVVSPQFAKIYFDEYKRAGEQYTKICNVNSSTSYQEKLSEVSGVGAWAQTTADDSVSFEDPKQLYDTTLTHLTYSKGVRIQRELWDDDLFGVMKKIPKVMGYGAKYVVEQAVANIYNRAFATYTKADCLVMCSDSHPIEGGTEDNYIGAVDLSASTLEDAKLLLRATVDYKGLLLALRPKILLIHPALEDTANKLIKSSLDPENLNNAINPIKDYGMTVVVNDYLTDSDAWFVIADMNPVEMYWREKPVFDSYVDQDTRAAKFSGFMRFSVDTPTWRGIVGSAGA